MDFIHPVGEYKISSYYGWRIDPFTKKISFHKGLDYATPVNTLVYASLPGKVIVSSFEKSFGNYIILDHGENIQTLYAHLNESLVKIGDYVNQNDAIAKTGNSGRSTAPHLHFEILINKKSIDPKKLLKLPPQTTPKNNIFPLIIIGGIIFYLYK